MNYEHIVAKIAKLLRLADRGATPGECAAAAGQAQALMTRYKIEAATAEAFGNAPAVPEEDTVDSPEPLFAGKRNASWKVRLAMGIANANNVFLFNRQGSIMLVGCASDIQSVRYLYDLLNREVTRLVKANCKGTTRTWNNNFRLGAVDAISDSLKAAREAQYAEARSNVTGNFSALVVVNKALDKLDARARDARRHAHVKFNLRHSGSSRYTGDADARAQGRTAGAGVNVNGSARASLGAGRRELRG